jgi:hypothetical protein
MNRAIAIAVLLAAPALHAGGRSHSNTSIDNDSVRSCSDVAVRFGSRPAAISEETLRVTPSQARGLSINAGPDGGVWVLPAAGSEAEVTLCRAVPKGEESTLDRIRVIDDHGKISVSGPETEWLAHLIVRLPRGSSVDVSAENGPVSIEGIEAGVHAMSVNGPVSVRACSGEIDVRSENGPVSMEGDRGQVRLEAANGPLAVRLSGNRFLGRLDGHTENGPVALRCSKGYSSGISIEASGHSPIDCHHGDCDIHQRGDDDARHVDIGSGETRVRLSTVNGPVSIRAAE